WAEYGRARNYGKSAINPYYVSVQEWICPKQLGPLGPDPISWVKAQYVGSGRDNIFYHGLDVF
ncbi:MAG: hypothetical protein WCI71_15460, partial [Bacteroidota bacterium]